MSAAQDPTDLSHTIPAKRLREKAAPLKDAGDLASRVEALIVANERLERKVDALVRHLLLDQAGLSPVDRIHAARVPMLSQHEEAGMLVGLFRQIGFGARRFVDIGAGVNGGNSGFFALEAGWTGLLVDEAPQCIEALTQLYEGSGGCVVAWSVTPSNINHLFESHGLTGDLDLLSLDVDGPDYWVWEALTAVRPRVFVAEYNSAFGPTASVTIPYDREFDHRALSGADKVCFGVSLTALTRLSARKGYRLITTDRSGANAVFLRNDVGPEFPAATPEAAFRWLPKHKATVRKVGGNFQAYCASRGLALVEVA